MDLIPRDLLTAYDRAAGLLGMIDELFGHGFLAVHDIITQQHGEMIVTDEGFGTAHGMSQALLLFLADGMYGDKI